LRIPLPDGHPELAVFGVTVWGVPEPSPLVQKTVLFTPITTLTVSGEKPGGVVDAPVTIVTLTQAADGQVTDAAVEVVEVDVCLPATSN